ncbi:MAG TPA: hypothetical protein VER55_04580, partial [Ardenticatenaceae bacterium]|nr:hypothetical protein [Ardenticatenaceae bacterium]
MTRAADMVVGSDQIQELRGRALLAARLGWLALATLAVGLIVPALPLRYAQLQRSATWAQLTLSQLAPAQERRFIAAMLDPDVYPLALFSLELTLVIGFWTIAALLFWRKSNEPIGLLAAVAFLLWGPFTTPFLDALVASEPSVALPVRFLFVLAIFSALTFFYLFPTGRFVPHWTRFLAVVWAGWMVVTFFFPEGPYNYIVTRAHVALQARTPVFWFMVLLAWWFSAVYAQIYRYRHVATPSERRSTKWVVVTLAVAVVGFSALAFTRLSLPAFEYFGLPRLIYDFVLVPLHLVFETLIPFAVAFAVLRHRLFDIDVLVRRTLIYAPLSALLVVIYVASAVVLQELFANLAGGGSDLAIIVATLVSAALFNPLRLRIQAAINQRFYRRQYDLEKTLEAFGAAVRNEVDLSRLTAELLTV